MINYIGQELEKSSDSHFLRYFINTSSDSSLRNVLESRLEYLWRHKDENVLVQFEKLNAVYFNHFLRFHHDEAIDLIAEVLSSSDIAQDLSTIKKALVGLETISLLDHLEELSKEEIVRLLFLMIEEDPMLSYERFFLDSYSSIISNLFSDLDDGELRGKILSIDDSNSLYYSILILPARRYFIENLDSYLLFFQSIGLEIPLMDNIQIESFKLLNYKNRSITLILSLMSELGYLIMTDDNSSKQEAFKKKLLGELSKATDKRIAEISFRFKTTENSVLGSQFICLQVDGQEYCTEYNSMLEDIGFHNALSTLSNKVLKDFDSDKRFVEMMTDDYRYIFTVLTSPIQAKWIANKFDFCIAQR